MPLLRLLAVDDEPLVRSAVARALSSAFVVSQASSADAAEQMMLRLEFDIVVTDFDMPGRNGAEVLKSAKKLQPRCKRVLLTGAVGIQFDPEFCDLLLEKPWESNAALRSALLALFAQ